MKIIKKEKKKKRSMKVVGKIGNDPSENVNNKNN
jgi:hypothetical protein